MARRSGSTNKTVEEKRRNLPIYQHYTLSPGKTKSHHPEAKCNHCLKEFVCGSKQRLIRHLRKCDSITNSDEIIADTLNTLARNSATGQLNHSILEASNLLPSQITRFHQPHQPNHPHNHITSQHLSNSTSATSTNSTTANNNMNNTSVNNTNNTNNNNNIDGNNVVNNHNTSGSSSNDTMMLPSSSNGSIKNIPAGSVPGQKTHRRGRKPANQTLTQTNSGIQVTTGIDGKAHFAPLSQLSSSISSPIVAQMSPLTNSARSIVCHQVTIPNSVGTAQHLTPNSGQLTANQHPLAFKVNSESIDKAYLKLVLTRNLPLSLCDTKEFQNWVRTFGNDYKPPTSINLITQNLETEAQLASQKISNILVKAPKKTINLELHSWSDENRSHLWYAIVAITDQRRFLVSVRDIFSQIHPRISTDITNQVGASVKPEKALTSFVGDCIKRLGGDRVNSLLYSGSTKEDIVLSKASQLIQSANPSIITYDCWWHYTNLMCSDIVEHNEPFLSAIRDSKRLINFIQTRPRLGFHIEKYKPFKGISGALMGQNQRWHSHLVCYLLSYISNNRENITKILEALSNAPMHPPLISDDNNNNSGRSSMQQDNVPPSGQSTSTQDRSDVVVHLQDDELNALLSIIRSTGYWTNLNLALEYLKPLHNIVALASVISSHQNQNGLTPSAEIRSSTLQVSPTIANGLLLSDYVNWFLFYGKKLFDCWRESPDNFKFQLIGRYLNRFNDSFDRFRLAFAAYLLNPKYRCAFMTRKAKELAIEEILNIASEFMTEESDGLTIFDQWKLYLNREEPYDVAYDDSRSTPCDWWMALPCAESIRRVAMRILRLRAFSIPKYERLFLPLYVYEDESGSMLPESSFENLAIIRYFYDHEDKIGQSHVHANANDAYMAQSNGISDRTESSQLHNIDITSTLLPAEHFVHTLGTDNQHESSMSGNQSFTSTFSDIMEPFNSDSTPVAVSNLTLSDHIGYGLFSQYVDFNENGVVLVEEPIEKKRRKWTAQEILSRCQSSNQGGNDGLKSK